MFSCDLYSYVFSSFSHYVLGGGGGWKNDTYLPEVTLDDRHVAVCTLSEEAYSGATLLQVVVVTRILAVHCRGKKN